MNCRIDKDTADEGARARAAELGLELEDLRQAIRDEYEVVATRPEQDFHFHTGRKLASLLEYEESWLEAVPETSIASFARFSFRWRSTPSIPSRSSATSASTSPHSFRIPTAVTRDSCGPRCR